MAGPRRTLRIAGALALALSLAAAPAASADSFDRIFKDYQRTGKVDPCKYSKSELESAQGQVPNDIEAYAPDFPDALQAAAEQRAGGACRTQPAQQQQPAQPAAPSSSSTPPSSPSAAGAPATPGAPGAAGAPATPAPTPAPKLAPAAADRAIVRSAQTLRSSDAHVPAPVIVLAGLGALLVLAGLAYGLARWLAFDPRWARSTRHAIGEAGWRVSATWAEFTDWVRLGR